MRQKYLRLMAFLYWFCVSVAGVSITTMALIIAWGVFSRYVLERGSFWPEPISIFLAIHVTFYGAAACYRANAHISLNVFVKSMPDPARLAIAWLGHVLMGGISLFMVIYGISLVKTTFFQVYPEFQYIRVGAVYSAIPIAGAITFLFVIERALFGREEQG